MMAGSGRRVRASDLTPVPYDRAAVDRMLNELRVLVETLHYYGGDTGPGGDQADQDGIAIVGIIERSGLTAPGPFICPDGCGRKYSVPHEAATCWRHHDHTGVAR